VNRTGVRRIILTAPPLDRPRFPSRGDVFPLAFA
jgi:hypothetical protein